VKTRIRFSELAVGDAFEFAGKDYKKITDRRGQSQRPRNDAIFERADLVQIEAPEAEEDGGFYPMYGITGSGSANPNPTTPGGQKGWGSGSSGPNFGSPPITPSPKHSTSPIYTDEELNDMYGIDWDQIADKCN
jgi:hypothetical protein